MRPINVILSHARNGFWSFAFDHPVHKLWVGGFFSEFAARAHARECAASLGRGVVFSDSH